MIGLKTEKYSSIICFIDVNSLARKRKEFEKNVFTYD